MQREQTLVETSWRRMLSIWLPCWLKTKCGSLVLGMINWTWTSSPNMDELKVKVWTVHSIS